MDHPMADMRLPHVSYKGYCNIKHLKSYPLVIPVLRSEYPEPFRPRHRRASMVTQGTNPQVHHDMLRIPRLDAVDDFHQHAFSPGYASLWNDAEVRNDWVLAAKGYSAEGAGRLRGEHVRSHEQRGRENKRRKHVTFEKEPVRDGRPSVDRMRDRRASVDREQERRTSTNRKQERLSVDKGRDLRLSAEHKHSRCPSLGRPPRYESVSSKVARRPPVSAVSFKPPTQYRHRRPSFEYATVRNCPYGHQYPIYILPPPAPVPRIYLPSRRDQISVDVDQRLPFPVADAPSFSRPSVLARFNPFNRLRAASIFAPQKELTYESPKVYSRRLHRRSTAGRA